MSLAVVRAWALLLCLVPLAVSASSDLDAALTACAALDADGCRLRLESVVASDPAGAYFSLGLVAQQTGEQDVALAQYERALTYAPEHVDALNNLGKVLSEKGSLERAAAAWTEALRVDNEHRMARMNLALHLHGLGDFAGAMRHWDLLLAKSPEDVEGLYNAGVTRQHLGQVSEAAEAYAKAIALRPTYTEALVNLATLHHRFGSVDDAIYWYEKALETVVRKDGDTTRILNPELAIMIKNNVGVALLQLGKSDESIAQHEGALAIAEAARSQRGGDDERRYANDADLTRGHVMKARLASCDWRGREESVAALLENDRARISRGDGPVLLPFDTLLLPVDGETRLAVAKAQSRSFEKKKREDVVLPPGDARTMRVAYLCYDFNDHPTAHLVEGLFKWHKRFGNLARYPLSGRFGRKTWTAALSYGKDDGSVYRASIRDNADKFASLNELGHSEAIKEARRWPRSLKDKDPETFSSSLPGRGPFIAVDLQGHTLGSRMELAANRVAPIQASYLIFPGTTGASFVDYIIADAIVTPPEHQALYAEKLVLLPGCYQVNDYERYRHKLMDTADLASLVGAPETTSDVAPLQLRKYVADMRAANGLPAKRGNVGPFVFCNFNKNDKLEPLTFDVWMNILRRVPESVLWMLQPSKKPAFESLKANLEKEAAARGVDPKRLIWAQRLLKGDHLARHVAADLFLDSFVYGAHSTATDALRGGLPVITLKGGTFPQRVGTSLLESVEARQNLLICDYLADLETLAVRLAAEGRFFVRALRRHLMEEGPSAPLFDTANFTQHLEKAYRLMWETYRADGNTVKRHIVVHRETNWIDSLKDQLRTVYDYRRQKPGA